MKKSSLLAILAVAAVAVTAGPALAKTSLAKGKQLCEAATKAQAPDAKSVLIDKDETRISDASLTYKLRVRAADDTQSVVVCKIDRETDTPTLTAG